MPAIGCWDSCSVTSPENTSVEDGDLFYHIVEATDFAVFALDVSGTVAAWNKQDSAILVAELEREASNPIVYKPIACTLSCAERN